MLQINNGTIISKGGHAGGIVGTNASTQGTGFIIECINNGDVRADAYVAGGITSNGAHSGSLARGYVVNCYNTGTILGGLNRRGGIVGQVKCMGGISYIYNCYNRGNIDGCPEIIGYDWGGEGDYISLNNYGSAEATVEKLNVESEVEQALKDTNLYHTNVWVEKDGKITSQLQTLSL